MKCRKGLEKRMKFHSIKKLDETGLVRTVCTFREEGKWKYGEDGCLENYVELGKELGIGPERMVRPSQTHTTVVRAVSGKNAGNGVLRPPDEGDCDGLMTNEKNLLLCTREADCVPVFMLDPVNKAVAMVHSGWKGTAGLISTKAIGMMREKYGTEADELLVALGPCICGPCYEVGGELIDDFSVNFSREENESFFTPRADGKYSLDVAAAVKCSLLKAGVKEDNLQMPEYCTYHDGLFSSYRLEKAYTTHMLTAIMLI